MSDLIPTRSALLELRDEQGVMREGHAFLDEKRVLLASEIVVQLKRYESQRRAYLAHREDARTALAHAVQRHGLEGLAAYPAADSTGEFRQHRRSLLGVPLTEARLDIEAARQASADLATTEGEHAKTAFLVLLEDLAALAATTANLTRLLREYQRTERRARALEDVIIPELKESIKAIGDVLEAQELEEAIRVRSRRPG
ncbi:MAG: V-type ATP synthase subunit D [Chromatiales bacterium]|nr:V-type ATP synthase subunit D [Chromatiales bacterium]